ncbi:S-layer homology domain-containing protein [Peptoniphilus lacrimalis]
MAGTGFIFDKWRLGTNPNDQIIKPAEERQYSKDTTIYGSFTKLKDIIPSTNDDGTPNLQPIDYVAVLFIGGDHANKLDGQILYYVNPKANPAQTIGNLTKPTVTPDTGWKHTGWDVQDSTVIKDYIFVVAQYEALDDVIPKTKVDDSEKPAGYVKVTFKAGANGKLQGGEKTYFVNPNKYVKLTPPTTVPNTSFEFSTWESDGKDFILANNINYTKDTIITAKFNTKGDVIPKTKSDDSQKPPTFVKVTFVIDPTDAGKIEDGQTITYFVRPNTEVTIHPPKTTANTGYEFEKWSIDTTEAKQYTTDTTVKGEFKKLNDIIPSKNPDGTVNAKPEGYVIVNFLKGDHGVLDGRTTFYVNPKAGKKLKDLDISGITVVPMPTYKFSNWDKPMETAIAGTSDINVTAEYTQLPNIIKAGPKDTAPSGYVVIIFETDGKGTIKGNDLYENEGNKADSEREIVYFVNPKKDVKLAPADATASQTQLPVPKTSANNPDKYIFDQWLTEIDTKSPIIRGRVHIATFKPKVVKLTYDANEATGTVPAELTVDYDTNVRLAGKGDLAKKDASFKGWKIGTEIHQAGDQINLKENTTAYAQWDDDKKIIEYNPVDNPTTRPDNTYVRVTFAVEDGLKLKEQKAYYVKKDAGIKLGDTNLAKPGYTVETGYKFDKWDKEDSLVITEDILVTAKSTKLGTVIPEKDTKGNKNAKPEGYKEVVFKVKDADADKGTLEGVTKFYVNPTEYVTINPPTTKANTGFEFGAWDKDTNIPTVYKDEVTTIEAGFNERKDVVPKTKTDDSEKPKGYVTVTFEIDPATGGQIVKDEVTVYYVNPAKDVTLPQPKTLAETGYVFEKWDQDTTTAKRYTDNTTVKGNFKKLEDIIPSTDDKGKPNAKPDAYVTVTFDKGEHASKIEGQKVYYVNPKANKTIADLGKPKVTAETGYKFTGWNFADTKEILSDLTVIAQYKEIDDVIPKTKNDETEKPEGYITVTFSAEENGKLTGQAVYYVNPNKAHVLKDKAPKVTPNTGFDFAGWDTQIERAIQYKDKYVIKALYNTKGDVIPQKNPNGSDKPDGYVKVMFDRGDHGELSGQTVVYYVNPNKEVTVPAPTVNAGVGYEFSKWDKALKQKFKEDTRITAEYKPLAGIFPQEKTDGSDKPSGYITVTFKADAKGSLEGKTVYYVNPEKIVDLTDTAKEITKNPNTGYTAEGGTWKNSDSKNLNDTFNKDTEFVFNFAERPDVIKKIDDNTKLPNGYVTVKFIPTDKATDTKEKIYFVNPLKKVKITEEPTGTKVKDANDVSYDYEFTGWTVTRGAINSWKGSTVSDKFIQDTDITAKYNVTIGNIMPLPLAKDNAVTAIKDKPEAKDLIKNPGDLPKGTTFAYTADGEPKVDETGKTTAKVEVKYPNGKTTIVKVPVLVVDNVVEQKANVKPPVPDSYIKVTVDPTDAATDNTNNKKIFWVKPNTEVKLDGIYDPIGKDIVEGKVTKPNKFTKWTLKDSDPVVEYKVVANSITTSFAKESTIIANYENLENIPPVGKENPWFSQYSKPEPKDFIKNAYDDNNPDAVGTLPPGTKFKFKNDIRPATGDPGTFTATIEVTYPNGEVKDIDVKYTVTGDVVEERPGETPTFPDYFVRVIVKTTDLATDDSKFEKTFWVNPKIEVTITVANPKGKYVPKDQNNPSDFTWKFNGWETEDKTKSWNDTITGQFKKETTIVAEYVKGQAELVDIYYTTESWKGVNNYLPTEDQLKALVKSKVPGEVKSVELLTDSQDFTEYAYSKLSENGINQINRTETINAKVTLKDGTVSIVEIPIVVYKNIYEGLTNGGKPDYVAKAEHDLKKSNPGRDDNDYVRVTLIPTAKAKNQQRKTYYVRKNASVIIPEIKAEGRDAYKFIYWKAEKPGQGQDNPNYGWATRSMSMFRSAEPINKDDLVNNGEIIDKVDGNTRMSFDRDTDIVAQYKTPTPTPTPDEPDKPNPDYPKYPDYPEYRPNYSGGSTIYIEKPVEKVIKVPDNAFVKEVRYMQGFEGKFRPFDGLTRAEAAQILANALKEDGYKYDPNYKISYKDIGNAWYTEAVKIVTQANVFKGYDDGNFKPQEKITRAEWIGTLKRFQELSDLSGNHMNLREGHWAMAEIEAAYQAGWLAIYSDGLADFKADEFIPRQEVAAVSNKAFERVLDKTYIKRNDKALVNYKDINDKMWSYEDILCASNTFLHDKKLYRAHGIDMSNEIFNINLDGFTITKDKFQRIER